MFITIAMLLTLLAGNFCIIINHIISKGMVSRYNVVTGAITLVDCMPTFVYTYNGTEYKYENVKSNVKNPVSGVKFLVNDKRPDRPHEFLIWCNTQPTKQYNKYLKYSYFAMRQLISMLPLMFIFTCGQVIYTVPVWLLIIGKCMKGYGNFDIARRSATAEGSTFVKTFLYEEDESFEGHFVESEDFSNPDLLYQTYISFFVDGRDWELALLPPDRKVVRMPEYVTVFYNPENPTDFEVFEDEKQSTVDKGKNIIFAGWVLFVIFAVVGTIFSLLGGEVTIY